MAIIRKEQMESFPDPLLAWAKEILDGPADCNGAERLGRLYEEIKQQRGGPVGGQHA